MKWNSLRVRFGMYYAVFTLGCLSLFGIFLTLYLKRALEDSRLPAMTRRTARLTADVDLDLKDDLTATLQQSLERYLKVAPETDEVVVRSSDGKKLLFAGGNEPFVETLRSCTAPCYREYSFNGRRLRTYLVHTTLGGLPVQLMMAGRIDENTGILQTVRTSYLLFVPFLLLASLTGGYVLSGKALTPVGRMTAMASRLSISDLRGRVPVPQTGDELQGLAEAWNSMLARLQVSVERNAQFTSDASHDLRTSIAVILAGAQLGLSKPRTQEEHTRLLRGTVSECEHTLTLLEDLLMTARYGFEQHELSQEPVELASIVHECCTLFLNQADAKDQSFICDLIPKLWILGDRSLLRRLIGVLLENAIKYTPMGGAISVDLKEADARVVLAVRDTGPGIAASALPHIFDRHFRGPDQKQFQHGNGLGLNIARWIADAHRAYLTVETASQKGSVFQVSFPKFETATRPLAYR